MELIRAVMLAALVAAPVKEPRQPTRPWAGEELPLPLAVRTPEDLQFKAAVERHYLIFNLLAGGKAAWDAGDFVTAAARWESLLRLPDLPADVESATRPFALEARRRAGGSQAEPPVLVQSSRPEPEAPRPERPALASLLGTVTGGGALGPGGTVVMLRRASGATPRPKPAKGKVVAQKGKAFVPRVLAVPVGTSVEFRNDDEISHNVFSLSRPNDFDLGLYKGGLAKDQPFDAPGPVQLLCNIHTSMIGWIYVVDTPWFAQADANGSFVIKGVPPGDYQLEAWHESAATPTRQSLRVEGETRLSLAVGGDRPQPAFVPDKYGKPRQSQLGY